MKDKLLEITRKLVEIRSVADRPDKLKEIADFVEGYFSGSGLFLKRYVKNSRYSIVISNTKEKKKKIILNAHLDVVDGEDHLFAVTHRDNDIILGRGVYDMKSLSAMLMIAMETITRERPDLPIALILTTDEEISGSDGMEYLIKDIGYSCDIAYIPDGGGDFNILTEEKGVLELKLTAYGKTAHAAYLWRGSNAIVKLYELYRKIIEFYPLPKSLDDWKTSVNLSKIQGGDALNKVPGEASMFLNIRFPYPATAKDIIREIEKIIGNEHIKLEKIFDGSSFYSDPQNEYIQIYKGVAEKYLKREVGFAKAPGAADARFLSEKGVPVIITRCNGGGMHSSDEWVSLSSLIKQYEILIEYLRAL